MAPEAQTTPCPHCGKTYSSNTRICPDDGSVIEHSSPLVGQVGAVLDSKYRLDAFLSHGGMGAVYRATHVMLGKTIAVKLINPELVTSPEIVRRFQREARAATSLNHPNIVAVYDLGQTSDGTLYIAMEFVDGPSLKDAIERGRGMAPGRAIELLRQVAAALSRAHRQGIVHRDLKPHNIMLAQGDDGRELVKLVDFGIAKTFDEGTKLTSTGLPIGTPHYMAPEQASGAVVDARSDLYSVGVILFEMLTGTVPFDGEFTPAILFKHISEPPVAPSVKKPGVVPPVLDEIALRLLQKNPDDRYQSADELADALDDAALTNPPPDVTLPLPRTGTRPPAVRNTPVQAAASTAGPTVGPTGAPTRTPAPKAPAPVIQATPVQRAPATAVGPTVVMTKPTPAPAPAAAAAARVADPVAPSPPQAATLPPAAAVPATSKSSSSSAVVLIGFLVAGIIATVGAAYYFNGRGSPVSTEVATNSATATSAPATESSAKAAAEASTPAPAPPPSATLPASSPSVPADTPANPGAATQGAPASARPNEPAANPAPPPAAAPAAGNARVNQPPAGNPPSPKATASPPAPPARGSGAPSQGQSASQPARASGQPVAAAPAPVATAAAAAQAPVAAGQAPAAAARREVPAPQAAAATFPEKPVVFFRCSGPNEVCNPLRTAVDEALGGAGLTIVRRPTGADIDVEAQVEVLQQNVDRQFGTTFAVRTYSIVLNGETTKTGEVVSMPSVENLSFDQRVGSERANERARLVAAGVVERVKAFAAAKKAR